VIPEDVATTMRLILDWDTIGPGRRARIRRWIRWLEAEVERRK
jgi:hypothetical protein